MGSDTLCAANKVWHYHRQCGSDCTVLTATSLVNGEGQILTPYRIATPKLIDIKFGIKYYVGDDTLCQIWCKSVHGGFWANR